MSSNNNSSLLKSSSSSTPPPPPLRIADVLLLDPEDDQADGAGFPFSLLMDGCRRQRREREAGGVVSRWFRCFTRPPKDQPDDDHDDVTDGPDLSPAVAHSDYSGPSGGCRCRRESSFNVGVGCSLLYLIAASKAELDKMVDLRTQMQVLLQNFKEQLPVRTTSEEGVGSNCRRSSQNLAISHVQPESSTTTTTIMTYDQSLKCDTPKYVECLEGIDQLQAELETELERLQLHLDKDKLLQHPEQQSVEVQVTLRDTAFSRSYSMSSGEVIDPVIESQDAFTELDYGVPPYELERRLHEVLEARQQEHIIELEAALECAKHKLIEKEMEISWWRDTARLIAQHVPELSRRISERG